MENPPNWKLAFQPGVPEAVFQKQTAATIKSVTAAV
jgi:hypothetical protein